MSLGVLELDRRMSMILRWRMRELLSRGITLVVGDADGAVLSDGQERHSLLPLYHFDIVAASANGTVDGCSVCQVPRLAIAV